MGHHPLRSRRERGNKNRAARALGRTYRWLRKLKSEMTDRESPVTVEWSLPMTWSSMRIHMQRYIVSLLILSIALPLSGCLIIPFPVSAQLTSDLPSKSILAPQEAILIYGVDARSSDFADKVSRKLHSKQPSIHIVNSPEFKATVGLDPQDYALNPENFFNPYNDPLVRERVSHLALRYLILITEGCRNRLHVPLSTLALFYTDECSGKGGRGGAAPVPLIPAGILSFEEEVTIHALVYDMGARRNIGQLSAVSYGETVGLSWLFTLVLEPMTITAATDRLADELAKFFTDS